MIDGLLKNVQTLIFFFFRMFLQTVRLFVSQTSMPSVSDFDMLYTLDPVRFNLKRFVLKEAYIVFEKTFYKNYYFYFIIEKYVHYFDPINQKSYR